MSPASSTLRLRLAWWAQMPARQSACSSRRTESWFASRSDTRVRACCTLSEMPSRFCTWWPISCAITYAWAKSPGAPKRW